MQPDDGPQSGAQPAPRTDADHSPSRSRRTGQRRGPRHEDPVEERRSRPRPSERTGSNGFRDGVEHAFCAAMPYTPPPTGVIVHRPGIATMAHLVVARRDNAALQCDLQHAGPHVWPDGEAVETTADAGAD